jgi:tetratricopeptide (TPR) repeat protein
MDRARLYRQHGQALEYIGRIDEAFDAYRRARDLWPDDPWLKQRFATSSPPPSQ